MSLDEVSRLEQEALNAGLSGEVERSLRLNASIIGTAPDADTKAKAMRRMAMGNFMLGNDGLAQAWAERALSAHQTLAMRQPDDLGAQQQLLHSASINVRVLVPAALDRRAATGEYDSEHLRRLDGLAFIADAARTAIRRIEEASITPEPGL